MPENCPKCQAERSMVSDGRVYFKCGSVYEGDEIRKGCKPLGERLREISDRAIAEGLPLLSLEEIDQRVCEARGAPIHTPSAEEIGAFPFRFVTGPNSLRMEVTAPSGEVFEFAGVRKGAVGF